MESRFAPIIDGENKKKYCDKTFKNSLCKALTVNNGDPDNISKINCHKNLIEYPASRIIAVSGLPDVTPLNVKSRDVLFGAYKVLMDQVDKDATPEFLNDIKHAISRGDDISMGTKFAELSNCLNHPSLNPLGLPFSYMVNGVLPDTDEQTDVVMGNVAEENKSTETRSNPANNAQFSFSSSTVIQDEITSGSEQISSDNDETETSKSKKTKICRKSKRNKNNPRLVL
ncbi:unnamed protein product [Diamesa serratosioi]